MIALSDKRSKVVLTENEITKRSHLIKAYETGLEVLEAYEDIPQGMFGFEAVIKSGSVTLNSNELDFEFTVPFDDDLEANEIEIIVYNLTDNTINNLERAATITIEAGYNGDTGVIFSGFIDNVRTGWEDVDKVTTLTCYNCAGTETVESITYSENTKASTILRDLIDMLGMPVAVFSTRRDYTYTSSVTVDGCIREEIKKYAEVCGISVYANNGSIYARYIKDGDNINFTVNEDTGLINSPEHYTEEINAEDYVDIIDGYECEMILQHRITTAAIINLTSRNVSGTFRVRKGEHTYADGEALTTFEAIGDITSYTEEKASSGTTKTASTTSSSGKTIVNYAKKLIGTPYVWGGYSVSGFDCSGFVSYVMINCGVSTKVTSRVNAATLYSMSTKLSAPDVGDIIYFDNGDYKHIGICVGNGKMIHCYDGGGVKITSISEGGTIVGYGRLY